MKVTCTGARDVPEGWDGPEPLHAACGVEFDFEPEYWDVHTYPSGSVARESRAAMCPNCGTSTIVVRED